MAQPASDHAGVPAGWVPYTAGTWPPDGTTIDALHPEGDVSAGCRYRHWDLITWPPLHGPLGRTVIAWRPTTPREG